MKVKYTSSNGALEFELESPLVVDLFESIAKVQEVFETATQCGMCESTNLRYAVREVDDNKFYEVQCQAIGCRARFAFGQHKKGGSLFPKRKDAEGEWIPNGGWTRYEKPLDRAPEHSTPFDPPHLSKMETARNGSSLRRELPEPLKPLFSRVEKDRHQFANVCRKILENMLQRDAHKGQQAYDSVLDAVDRKFPRGIAETSDMREVLIDLWEAAESLDVLGAGMRG